MTTEQKLEFCLKFLVRIMLELYVVKQYDIAHEIKDFLTVMEER